MGRVMSRAWRHQRNDGYRRSQALGSWLLVTILVLGIVGIVVGARVLAGMQ